MHQFSKKDYYWIHRISHEAQISKLLLDKGFLTIGFSDFANESIIEATKGHETDKWPAFEDSIKGKWLASKKTRFSLYRFLRMRKGDIVLVPKWKGFDVCEVLDDTASTIADIPISEFKSYSIKAGKLNRNGDLIDLGFFRKVKVLFKNVSREKYADAALTARLKVRQTNVLVKDITQNIHESIEAYIDKRPINLKSNLLESIEGSVLNLIQKNLNEIKFEHLIKRYFESIGASNVHIPPKNERDKQGDADIIADFPELKIIILVQAKFHSGKTKDQAINQIDDYTSNHDRIEDVTKIPWVISTAKGFTNKAIEESISKKVTLIDGLEFSRMLLNAGIRNLDNLN